MLRGIAKAKQRERVALELTTPAPPQGDYVDIGTIESSIFASFALIKWLLPWGSQANY